MNGGKLYRISRLPMDDKQTDKVSYRVASLLKSISKKIYAYA